MTFNLGFNSVHACTQLQPFCRWLSLCPSTVPFLRDGHYFLGAKFQKVTLDTVQCMLLGATSIGPPLQSTKAEFRACCGWTRGKG